MMKKILFSILLCIVMSLLIYFLFVYFSQVEKYGKTDQMHSISSKIRIQSFPNDGEFIFKYYEPGLLLPECYTLYAYGKIKESMLDDFIEVNNFTVTEYGEFSFFWPVELVDIEKNREYFLPEITSLDSGKLIDSNKSFYLIQHKATPVLWMCIDKKSKVFSMQLSQPRN